MQLLNSYTLTSTADLEKVCQIFVNDTELEKRMYSSYSPLVQSDIQSLVIACDLRKSKKLSDVQLETFIQCLYSKIFLQCLEIDPSAQITIPKTPKSDKNKAKIFARAMLIVKQAAQVAKAKEVAIAQAELAITKEVAIVQAELFASTKEATIVPEDLASTVILDLSVSTVSTGGSEI
jgi:hypothetical protein